MHKRKLNEKKFVLSAIAFERAVKRDYFIFSAIFPICLTARKANGRGILTPWANACCEFLNRPKPLMAAGRSGLKIPDCPAVGLKKVLSVTKHGFAF